MLPTALDSVAPHTPSKIASPHKAILRMISGSDSSASVLARVLRTIGSAM